MTQEEAEELLANSRDRELGVQRDGRRAQRPHPRVRGRAPQQRGLADPRGPFEDEHAALAAPSALQHAVDRRLLRLALEDHRR